MNLSISNNVFSAFSPFSVQNYLIRKQNWATALHFVYSQILDFKLPNLAIPAKDIPDYFIAYVKKHKTLTEKNFIEIAKPRIQKWIDKIFEITDNLIMLGALPVNFDFILKTGNNSFDKMWLEALNNIRDNQIVEVSQLRIFENKRLEVVTRFIEQRDKLLMNIKSLVSNTLYRDININDIKKLFYDNTKLIDRYYIFTTTDFWEQFVTSQQTTAIFCNKAYSKKHTVAFKHLFAKLKKWLAVLNLNLIDKEANSNLCLHLTAEILTQNNISHIDDLTTYLDDEEVEEHNNTLQELFIYVTESLSNEKIVDWVLALYT